MAATAGTAAPSAGSVDFFDVTTNKDLGNGTAGASTGTSSTWTFLTGVKTLNVTTGDVIKATYTPGNGFTGSNGTVTQVVNPAALTVKAVTFTKSFDSSTSATGATPTITSGTLVTGDTSSFTETFDTSAQGTGKTLTPSGTVNDGNGGKNYTVTFLTDVTGSITPQAAGNNTAKVSLNIGAATPVFAASPAQVVPVFIDISNISPASGGAGGIGSGSYYVKYDPTVLSINETTVAPGTTGSDIQLGSLLSSLSAGTTACPRPRATPPASSRLA